MKERQYKFSYVKLFGTSRSLIISMFVTVGIQQYVRTRMCVCVCVCMYLSLCVCVCVCVYIHTHTHIHIQTGADTSFVGPEAYIISGALLKKKNTNLRTQN